MRIAIIGAGASGCFAAANIPKAQGRSVHIFEKSSKALQKVKVSGGGRCNTTHACFDVPELITRYPRGKQFLKKTLFQFSPQHTIDWFKQRGVTLKTEEDGRMFPNTDSSQTIIDCIWQELIQNGAHVSYNKGVKRIEKKGDTLLITFLDDSTFEADKVLIACGGFPKEEQYQWIKDLGHTIESPVPSLFTFNVPKHPINQLMGISVPNATVKVLGSKLVETGPLLITHWGFSGPAILKMSAWSARALQERNYHFRIHINWLGDIKEDELREEIKTIRQERGKQQVATKNPFDLPRRLWEHFMQQCGINEEVKWGDLPATNQNKLVNCLVMDEYEVKGKTTFKEEFVTCGGVKLSEVDPKTMESKKVSGLYFSGEILNVDGITGGYNFQHAWSSGYIAANNMVVD